MQEQYVIDLDSNHLLSIFAGSDLKQPYRFQPNVCIYVSFDEYIKFVEEMIAKNLKVLHFPLDYYKNALQANKPESLVNFYYVDMSKAITSELKMACLYGKDCTEICHDFTTNVNHVDKDSMLELYDHVDTEQLQKAAKYVNEDILSLVKGVQLSSRNKQAYHYAILLRSLSMVKNPIKFSFK